MSIAYTIPAEQYRAAQPVEVPYITDSERMALSYAYFDKQFDVRLFEDMATMPEKYPGVISGWADITKAYDAARNASIQEAMMSLDRLGLVLGYYEHYSPSRERILETTNEGMRVRSTGWRYKLTELGRQIHNQYRARIYKCCGGCVVLTCVCREKTFCADHGGGCHGTHD